MKLGPTQLEWHDRVRRKAYETGFDTFVQAQSNARPHAPSLLLVKPHRVIAVWLRTGRRRGDRQPDTTRLPESIETYVWYPEDWPSVGPRLLIEPVRDGA